MAVTPRTPDRPARRLSADAWYVWPNGFAVPTPVIQTVSRRFIARPPPGIVHPANALREAAWSGPLHRAAVPAHVPLPRDRTNAGAAGPECWSENRPGWTRWGRTW